MSTRRQFLSALSAAAVGPHAKAAPPLPNIVYILADDLGWGDLRCYNADSQISTPNADRLAQQGVRFTDMHSPSSVCTPTRYGILTGRYCWRSRLKQGVLQGWSSNLIEPGRMTVASMLKQRGYHTGAVGKWHLGFQNSEPVDYKQPLRPGPLDHGFDYFYGIPSSLDFEPYLYVENDRTVEQPTARTEGRNDPRGVFWRPGHIAPSFKMEEVLPTLTNKAIGYIQSRAKQSQPFFLYFPMTGPHTPWVPLKQYEGRSKAGIYGDFVTQCDDVLGRIMKALDDARTASNTLLVFTSDNGAHWTPDDKAKFPHRANANWRGMKADIYDAGHRIPFLARFPGRFPSNKVSAQLGCLTDLMATAAEVTGARLPNDAAEDSFSWLHAATGAKGKGREVVIHHSAQGLFGVRRGDWKLALGRGSGGFTQPVKITPQPGEPAGELYNLKLDPAETRNVYADHPTVVAELTALLETYQKSGRSRPAL
ncbi:MAG: arylsulfatase [Bryobacterales bacterium]|nr:arylsulfatase [Bryobacterales bacterium]